MVHSSLASNLVGLTTAYSPCLRTPRHTPRHRYTAQAGPDKLKLKLKSRITPVGNI